MRFIVTKETGKLARWLRLLGFDTVYYHDKDIGPLAIQTLREGRTIITRNRHIPHLEKCTVVVDSNDLHEQLKEVKQRLGLEIDYGRMFTRCTACNEPLSAVAKEMVKASVPELVYRTHQQFMQCPGCKKLYWQGSHWGKIQEVVAKLLR